MYRDDLNVGMGICEDSKYFVCKRLTDGSDAHEIEDHHFESIDSRE